MMQGLRLGFAIGNTIQDRMDEAGYRDATATYSNLLSQDVEGMSHEDFKKWNQDMRAHLPNLREDDMKQGALAMRKYLGDRRNRTLGTISRLIDMDDMDGAVDMFNSRRDLFSSTNKVVLNKLMGGDFSAEEVSPDGSVRSARVIPKADLKKALMSMRHFEEGGVKQEANQQRADDKFAWDRSMDVEDLALKERRTRASEASSYASAARSQQAMRFAANDEERKGFRFLSQMDKDAMGLETADLNQLKTSHSAAGEALTRAESTIKEVEGSEGKALGKFWNDHSYLLTSGNEDDKKDFQEMYKEFRKAHGITNKARADEYMNALAAREEYLPIYQRLTREVTKFRERGSRQRMAIPEVQTGVVAGQSNYTQEPPRAAIEYLKNNPGAKEQFKAKYGALPPGF